MQFAIILARYESLQWLLMVIPEVQHQKEWSTYGWRTEDGNHNCSENNHWKMRIEVSENLIQYKQIARKFLGLSYFKYFPVKGDLSCSLMNRYINTCIPLKIKCPIMWCLFNSIYTCVTYVRLRVHILDYVFLYFDFILCSSFCRPTTYSM